MAVNLNGGNNKVLIGYLRQHGGKSVTVPCTELAKQCGFNPGTFTVVVGWLEKKGFVTVEKKGRPGTPPVVTLNEEQIAAYMASGKTPAARAAGSAATSHSRTAGISDPKPKEIGRVLNLLNDHQFQEGTLPLVQDLMNTAAALLVEREAKVREIASLRENQNKLIEAARGLEAIEEDLTRATKVSPEEIAGNVDYETMPSVPSIDFAKLLSEPPKIFKPLARLQHGAKYLHGLLVEYRRETARLTLINGKLNALVAELQSVETVDFSAALNEWQKESDRVLNPRITRAIATVSTRE